MGLSLKYLDVALISQKILCTSNGWKGERLQVHPERVFHLASRRDGGRELAAVFFSTGKITKLSLILDLQACQGNCYTDS